MRKLEDHELHQTAFVALQEHYTGRLQELKLSLEGPLDIDMTNKIREQIRWCKTFLAFNKADKG